MKYYYNEDGTAIGVLVSRGYGAGWSTWGEDGIALAMDEEVIQYWLSNKNDSEEEIFNHLKNIGYEVDYLGGWSDIELVWVPVGATFRIKEYDGAENVEIFDASKWVTVT